MKVVGKEVERKRGRYKDRDTEMERGSEVRKVSIAECYMFIRTGVYGSDYMKSFFHSKHPKVYLWKLRQRQRQRERSSLAQQIAVVSNRYHPLHLSLHLAPSIGCMSLSPLKNR